MIDCFYLWPYYREYQFELRLVHDRRIASISDDSYPIVVSLWCLGPSEKDNHQVHSSYTKSLQIRDYVKEGVTFSRLLNDALRIISDCRLNITYQRLCLSSQLKAAVSLVSKILIITTIFKAILRYLLCLLMVAVYM